MPDESNNVGPNIFVYFSSLSATTRSLTGLRWSRTTAPDQAGPRSQVTVEYAKEDEAQAGLHSWFHRRVVLAGSSSSGHGQTITPTLSLTDTGKWQMEHCM